MGIFDFTAQAQDGKEFEGKPSSLLLKQYRGQLSQKALQETLSHTFTHRSI